MIGVVPLEPAVDRATRDAEVGGDLNDASPVDVRADGAPSTPFPEIVLELSFDDELVELPELHGSAPRTANCLSCLGSRHISAR